MRTLSLAASLGLPLGSVPLTVISFLFLFLQAQGTGLAQPTWAPHTQLFSSLTSPDPSGLPAHFKFTHTSDPAQILCQLKKVTRTGLYKG